jgi:hypothetical protein
MVFQFSGLARRRDARHPHLVVAFVTAPQRDRTARFEPDALVHRQRRGRRAGGGCAAAALTKAQNTIRNQPTLFTMSSPRDFLDTFIPARRRAI